MNATEPYWWQVNIGSGNGLVPSGNKPLPKPVLTKISSSGYKGLKYLWIILWWSVIILSFCEEIHSDKSMTILEDHALLVAGINDRSTDV